MNPLRKAASLLKGKSVKQVQIDSDSESEVDSKSSTPKVTGNEKKRNLVTSPSKRSMFSPNPKPNKGNETPDVGLDAQLQQLQSATRRRSMVAATENSEDSSVASSPIQKPQNQAPVTFSASKAPSDRSLNQSIPSHPSTPASTPAPPTPPPPVTAGAAVISEETIRKRYQEQINQFEQDIQQLTRDKHKLEQIVTDQQSTIATQKQTILTNAQTIQSLEKKIVDMAQEQEEMRVELYAKYDEIHALGESKERLNAQYLEVAKQLRSLESDAMNKKYHTPPPEPVIPTPPPSLPPPPHAPSSHQRDEEIGELRHLMKEMEEKIKTQKSLIESKQLMNMKLDGRNRELIQHLDQLKSQLTRTQHEGHEKDSLIEKLQDTIHDYDEKYNGPLNIDKRKIAELLKEIEKLNEDLVESKKVLEAQEKKYQTEFDESESEMEFMRKLVREYEGEIESLEKMLEEESSEMTQLLIKMKGKSEGLYRFLQAIFRRYKEHEESQKQEQEDGISSTEAKEKGSDENEIHLTPPPPAPSTAAAGPSSSLPLPPPQPILDLQDVIFLLDSGILTLKVKAGHRPLHQMLTQLSRSSLTDSPTPQPQLTTPTPAPPTPRRSVLHPNSERSSSEKPSRPPPLSAGGRVSQECTLRLLEFLDKYQLTELGKHFRNLHSSSVAPVAEESMPPSPASPGPSSEFTPQRSPMKLGSSAKGKSRKPPVMMTPLPDQDNDSLASHSTQSTTTSTKTKGSEYVCFTINRGDGRPDEKWLEIVDTATSLKYYFNPQTGVTQWDLPIHTSKHPTRK